MRVTFPATRGELTAAGYEFVYTRPCKRCQRALEFWRTPENKYAPLEVLEGNKLQSHFSTCPFADEFRRPKQNELFA